ncbi:MAG: hypothetical protein GXO55_06820 [Chloroflexi bacterium]|nr:hypothetical protein [Chloroflexota bacterium]
MPKLIAAIALAFLVSTGIAILIGAFQAKQGKGMSRLALTTFLVIFLLVLGAAALTDSVVQIEAGTVGVVKRFGNIVGVFNPGLNFKLPFIDEVVIYRTQEIVYETSANPQASRADYRDYEVDTATADGQQITARYTVRFRILPERAPDILRNLGTEAEVVEKVVKASSRVHVRNILKRYEANELYSGNVEQAQNEIAARLREDFEKAGLQLTFFGLRSIQFTEEYKQAVERKQIEAENVKTKQHLAEQAKYEKQRAITQAEAEAERQRLERIGIAQGEAEAVKLRAEAEAEAIRIKAKAQAEANQLIAESLTPTLISWEAIKAWNGQYPLVVGDAPFILPGDLFSRNNQVTPTPTPTPVPTPEQ